MNTTYDYVFNTLRTLAAEIDPNLTLPAKVQETIADGYTLFQMSTQETNGLPRYDFYKSNPDGSPKLACWVDVSQRTVRNMLRENSIQGNITEEALDTLVPEGYNVSIDANGSVEVFKGAQS